MKYACCAILLSLPLLADKPLFQEISPDASHIRWVHENGRSQNRYLPETAGAGVAIFDYNNDDRTDILFVNSGSSDFFTPHAPLHHGLYRNNGDGTFTDVTAQAGINADLFGMGVAVADYDGDGWPDIFITGWRNCVLYHNNHNGTSPMSLQRAGSRRLNGAQARSGLITTTMANWISLSASSPITPRSASVS